MIDHIYIPTLGRANNQITFDNMPPKVQEITSLVIQPKEKDDYPNYPNHHMIILLAFQLYVLGTVRCAKSRLRSGRLGVFFHRSPAAPWPALHGPHGARTPPGGLLHGARIRQDVYYPY